MNKNTPILVIPDSHIGGRGMSLGRIGVGSSLNSRIIDQLNILNWIYDQAISRSIHHIVMTGDVFDEPKPHYTLVELLIDWLKKCVDSNLNVHIIAGNHDILRSGQFTTSPLDIINAIEFDNVFVYKKNSTIQLDNIGITFLPFRDRRSFNTDNNSEALDLLKKQIPYQLSAIDKFSKKLLIGHLALEGSIPIGNELGELANELFCPLSMFKGYDYVIMGHVHKFQVLQEEETLIEHLGSMDISDFGEVDQEKFIAIIDENGKLEHLKIPTRKLINVNIDLPETESNATEFVQNYLKHLSSVKDAIVKVNIKLPSKSSCSIDRTAIEKQLTENGAFFTSKISEERTFVSVKKQVNQTLDNAIDELSAIKAYSSLVEESIRDEFIKTAYDIVREYQENLK